METRNVINVICQILFPLYRIVLSCKKQTLRLYGYIEHYEKNNSALQNIHGTCLKV